MYNISNILQDVFTDTTEKSLKELKVLDRVMYQNVLKAPNHDDYIATPGETKPSSYKYIEISLDDHVQKLLNRSTQNETASDDYIKGEGLLIIIPSVLIDIYTRLEILQRIKNIWPYRYSNRS